MTMSAEQDGQKRVAAAWAVEEVEDTNCAAHRRLDIAIDGADQVERRTLNLIKGLGGALLREKMVASASRRMIVVADETKLVNRLSGNTPLPVEIVSFGWETVHDRLAAIGCAPRLRLIGGKPFTTDGGNYIVGCAIAEIPDPAALDARLSALRSSSVRLALSPKAKDAQ